VCQFDVKGANSAMRFLVLQAYIKLIVFDLYLARGNFEALYRKVRSYPRQKKAPGPQSIAQICDAMDIATIWYWKQAQCLQRSAATTCLLRRHGVPAEMIIGAQQLPFKAHAWVEVERQVVNDKPYMREMYAVLDHC
jgi:transglutaminase superfamily protein